MQKVIPNIGNDYYVNIECIIDNNDYRFNINAYNLGNNQQKHLGVCSSITELSKLGIPKRKKTKANLSIAGKRLITRTAQNIGLGHEFNPLEVIPGINTDEILFDYGSINQTIYVSLIRKDLITSLIEELRVNNILVNNINIGLAPLISSTEKFHSISEITTPHCKLEVKNETINIDYGNYDSEEKYNINGVISSSNDVVTNLMLLQSVNDLIRNTNDSGLLRSNIAELKYIRKSKSIATIAVFATFLLLLINYFFYSSSNKKLIEATIEYNKNKDLLEELHVTRESLEQKKKFISENGLRANSKYSLLLDNIGKKTPHDIILSNIIVNPEKKAKQSVLDSYPQYENNLIIISGNGNISSLNSFINNLETEEWVNDVDLSDFQNNNANKVAFTLKLQYQLPG